MRNHTIRQRLLATTIIGGALLALATPVMAQDATPQEEVTEIDEVVVTGSRIRRDPTNSPTPLIQVSGDQLVTTGQTSVINYLATIPALSNSVVPSDTTGSVLNVGGVSLPNLRALGANRTLTLVDGRRHVGATQGSLAVDIDSIPRLLIQSVEIVTGGASSVYGADAVSGVLNFILRKDFEGLEFDTNYGMINQDGQASRRLSVLAGANLLDDRLNLYAHGEYEKLDEVGSLDIDWLRDGWIYGGAASVDADPTATPSDGMFDRALFSNVTRLDRPRWGQTTLANSQQPSPLNDPDVPLGACGAAQRRTAVCYSVDPTRTFWYSGATARLADFGQRIGNVGANRPFTLGGDGEPVANFGAESRTPDSSSQRFQLGANFAITDQVHLTAEAKFVTEDTYFTSQPTFFDVFLTDQNTGPNEVGQLLASSQFVIRVSDNAFLPANVRDAILANTVTNYTAPTATAGGTPLAPVAFPWARHSGFGPQRSQTNNREVERYVIGLNGEMDRLGFIDAISWDLSYVFGEARNVNIERGIDAHRWALAADAVVDTAGLLGAPGAIVCRARLIAASNPARTSPTGVGGVRDDFRIGRPGTEGDDLRDTAEGRAALNECQPLNFFGNGNQSQAGLDYIDAAIRVSHTNQQEQLLGSISGQLWDFWGAGQIGVALGAEHRREYAEGIGRSSTTGDRFLFLNTGADFPASEYESDELFAELSVPLLRDSFLGDYAELSGTYRYADYSTVGEQSVYGVNLVYRPIRDIAFKTSFNTSIRVPNLTETNSPLTQTFFNGVVDPCATLNIAAQTNAQIRANRVQNCTALAAQQGLVFDFAGATATNVDDFNPIYTSGIAGSAGGNPFLKPEESESFTFSVVLEPRFAPNLSLVLDYYEIELDSVIAAVGAQAAVNNCVNGNQLNNAACATIFRRDPNPLRAFYIGAPANDPIGAFIQGSINYAALATRGLDFTVNYSYDLEEMWGRDWGRFDFRMGGLWLLEQETFLNIADPGDGTELSSSLNPGGGVPRVRFTSSLTYSPNDTWNVNWTVDWQSSQDISFARDLVSDLDSQLLDSYATGNFARHDFTVRYQVDDSLSLRAGVVNAFDAEQSRYLGGQLFANFDPYGTRFFIGLNYRPY